MENTVIITDRFSKKRGKPSPLLTSYERPWPTNEPPAHDLKPGMRLENYIIISPLGGGGMGDVYHAQDTVLNRPVALKILSRRYYGNPTYVSRFRTEAEAQAKVISPYVVTLHTLVKTRVGMVLVMEYLQGQTLARRLRHEGPLALDEVLPIFDQALTGAGQMHKQGVVHRDLKPGNIFLTHDHKVKLIDFGVAKLMDAQNRPDKQSLMGTLLYIAPEQVNGRNVDHRADIYTLGISLFEAVCGRLPFESKRDYALMHAHVQETPPRPSQYKGSLPKSLEHVILKAIQKEPHKRFQHVGEFRSALKHSLNRYTRPSRKKKFVRAIDYLDEPYPYSNRPNEPGLLRKTAIDLALVATIVALLVIFGMRPSKNISLTPELVKTQPPAASTVAERYRVLREAWSN